MKQVNIHEAKTHLSRLLAAVEQGNEVVISRAGRPIAILSPYREPGLGRRFGRDAGRFHVPDDFDAKLPEEILRAFEA